MTVLKNEEIRYLSNTQETEREDLKVTLVYSSTLR